MGISIDVGNNQDYSYLFQGISGSGSLGNLNFLSDYASIKNGSYGKLMKSYYGAVNSSVSASRSAKTGTNDVLDQILEAKKHPVVSKETQEANSKLTSGISALSNTVSKLQNEDTYKNSEDGVSAADKVVSAVKSYVSQYNDVVGNAKNSTLSGVTSHVAGMMRASSANSDKLAEIGVTINRDGTLTLDEDKLKSTDISRVQDLFSKDDVISYGSTVMSRLGFASLSSNSVSSTQKDDVKTDEKEDDAPAVSGAAALKSDINTLMSEALYNMITDDDGVEKYDIGKIFGAAKSFVENYNDMLKAASASSNSGVIANLARIVEKTAQNKNAFGQFGITVEANGSLKIDEDKFKKSDMSQVKAFFNDYGASVAANVSLVNYYMTTNADAATSYNADGKYNAQGNFLYDTVI